MRKLVFACLVCTGLVAGCAEADKVVGYDHETGQVDPDNPAATGQKIVKGFGPWGEIAGLVIAAVAGGYITVRKIQKKIKNKKSGG